MHPKLAGKSTIYVLNYPFPYKICLVLYLYNKWIQHLQRQRCLPPVPLADPWMKCCLMLCRKQNSVTGITTRKSKVFCTINSILCTTLPSAEMLGTAIQVFVVENIIGLIVVWFSAVNPSLSCILGIFVEHCSFFSKTNLLSTGRVFRCDGTVVLSRRRCCEK